MPVRIHGTAFAHENLSRNLQYYTVYTCSPNAFSDLPNATDVNIFITNDYTDESQRNFEVLLQSIGLRAMPVIMNNPVAVADVGAITDHGAAAPSLSGEGFIWKYAVELENVFENYGPLGTIGPVGFLIDELNGIVLPNGTVLITSGASKNIEFTRQELL